MISIKKQRFNGVYDYLDIFDIYQNNIIFKNVLPVPPEVLLQATTALVTSCRKGKGWE